MERKHGRVGHEARNWRHNPLQDRQGLGHRLKTAGGRSGLKNGVIKMEPIRANPQVFTGTLSMSMAEKGERPDGGRGGKNRLLAQGFRAQQGTGEQVEGVNTERVGTVSGGRRECTLVQVDRRSKTGRGGRIRYKEQCRLVKV